MGKDIINNWIIPFLSVRKRGFKSNFDLASIFLLILKRLKTGVQWRELPIENYFEKGEISWQNVYYYFNKWSKDVGFQRVWLNLLRTKRRKLDMSCVQLDGSHTFSLAYVRKTSQLCTCLKWIIKVSYWCKDIKSRDIYN